MTALPLRMERIVSAAPFAPTGACLQIAPTWNTEGRLSAVTIPFCTLMVSRFYPFFPFLSTFEYKADKNGTLPAAAGEAPTTAEAAPSVGSASVAAYIQKGWLATVGTVMMLAVGLVLVLF